MMPNHWQFVGNDTWHFGDLVRGVIRYPLAVVWWNGFNWHWAEHEKQNHGITGIFGDAIEAAERAAIALAVSSPK